MSDRLYVSITSVSLLGAFSGDLTRLRVSPSLDGT